MFKKFQTFTEDSIFNADGLHDALFSSNQEHKTGKIVAKLNQIIYFIFLFSKVLSINII